MITLKASEIAAIVSGELHGGDIEVSGPAYISSQEATENSIFAAFIGEKSNGHDYVSDAFAHGAVVALVSQSVPERHILVSDVQRALADLAKYVRGSLKNLKVVALTGSQGKTTTKELAFAVLSSHFRTVAPRGNFNNEIGVPLTLLQCDESTEICIVEMGARHKGDIAYLMSIAEPDCGVVLRVGAAHLGEFGSLEDIASAKSEIISGLKNEATAIVGLYDPFTEKMKSIHSGNVFTFGEKTEATIRATDVELREGRAHFDLVTPDGRSTVALRLVGAHQVSNALAAAAICHVLGLSNDRIASGLSIAESHARWRMEIRELDDLLLINDTYNASPESMKAALQTLVHFAQERGGASWAFVGAMRELGAASVAEHSNIGKFAAEIGIDHLVVIGAREYIAELNTEKDMTIHFCESKDEALVIAENLERGDVVLCKASRSERFEEVAEGIEVKWQGKVDNQ